MREDRRGSSKSQLYSTEDEARGSGYPSWHRISWHFSDVLGECLFLRVEFGLVIITGYLIFEKTLWRRGGYTHGDVVDDTVKDTYRASRKASIEQSQSNFSVFV